MNTAMISKAPISIYSAIINVLQGESKQMLVQGDTPVQSSKRKMPLELHDGITVGARRHPAPTLLCFSSLHAPNRAAAATERRRRKVRGAARRGADTC